LSLASRLHAAWDAYWFRPGSLRRLAYCRILFFTFFLIYHNMHDRGGLTSFSGTDVYAPMLITRVLHDILGVPYLTPSVQYLLYVLMVAFAAASLLGLRTGLSTMLTALVYTYLKAEAYSHGGYVHHPDAIVALSLWALALSPCGEVLSLDALRRRRGGTAFPARAVTGDVRSTSILATWPVRFISLFLAIAYFLAGGCKVWLGGGLGWVNGDTLRYYLVQGAMPLGMRLSDHHLVTQLMSIVTVLFELTFWLVLVFPALTWIYVLYGLSFHIGSIYLMNVHFIPFLMGYVFLLDWVAVEAKLRRWFGRDGAKRSRDSARGIAKAP
jgi:hypothetical protein